MRGYQLLACKLDGSQYLPQSKGLTWGKRQTWGQASALLTPVYCRPCVP